MWLQETCSLTFKRTYLCGFYTSIITNQYEINISYDQMILYAANLSALHTKKASQILKTNKTLTLTVHPLIDMAPTL